MNAQEIIKELQNEYLTTQKELAESLGVSEASLSRTLKNYENIKLSTFLNIINELQGKIIIKTDEVEYELSRKN